VVLIWLVSGLASFLFNKLFPRRGVFSFLMKAEFVFLKWLSGDVARESVRSNNESESAALSWLALLLLQVTYTHGKYKFCRVIHSFKQHIFITYLCFNISHCCFNFVHTLVCNVLLVLDVYSLSFRPPPDPPMHATSTETCILTLSTSAFQVLDGWAPLARVAEVCGSIISPCCNSACLYIL